MHTMTQNARQLPERTISSGGVLDYQNYYDANGNVEHIANNLGVGWDPRDRWMQYDQLDRLTAAGSGSFGGDHWHRMTYDALDNLKSWTLSGVKDYAEYVYDARNRLTSIRNTAGATVVAIDYDARGNLRNKNGQIHDFDYGNRLRAVMNKEAYRYDGLGRRIMNWRPPQPGASTGTLSFSMYSQNGQIPYEEDHHGTPTTAKENIYLAGSVIATRENKWGVSVEVKYQHTDALGSPVAVTDASGQIIERMDYEPWGAIIGKPNHNGIGYTGHVMDAATGLTYMQQRYYDQSVGRFLSVDPVTAYGGDHRHFNRYAYGYNNPYLYNDPDGRTGAIAALPPLVVVCALNTLCRNAAKAAGTVVIAYFASRTTTLIRDHNQRSEGSASSGAPEAGKGDEGAKEGQRPSKTPNSGEPGSVHVNPGSGQERLYGDDGLPELDVDYDHDHGQGQPHEHPWTRGPDGKPIRGDGRPVPLRDEPKPKPQREKK
ncbi:MAG: hypothetical protein KF800_05285 [Lysobacter sp.]|nr:hypothetical protein [Lysobacter sp.]